jgi:beta-lactamase class A
MTHLAMEDILTPPACREILSLMKRDRNPRRIGGHLPMRPDITVYHKTGTMKGVYNDVGLVRFSGGQYVISVFSKGVIASEDPRRPNEADEVIATLSRWVFDQLDQKGDYCHAQP